MNIQAIFLEFCYGVIKDVEEFAFVRYYQLWVIFTDIFCNFFQKLTNLLGCETVGFCLSGHKISWREGDASGG